MMNCEHKLRKYIAFSPVKASISTTFCLQCSNKVPLKGEA